jgi:acyl carrier protein
MSLDEYRIPRDQLPLSTPYIAPRTDAEERLAVIWRTALGMDRVGVDDSYHELGGDSLLAAVIFARIEDDFGVVLPMALLVTAPTIAKLALQIDAMLATRCAETSS